MLVIVVWNFLQLTQLFVAKNALKKGTRKSSTLICLNNDWFKMARYELGKARQNYWIWLTLLVTKVKNFGSKRSITKYIDDLKKVLDKKNLAPLITK